MTVVADWLMIHTKDGNAYQAVKERKHGEKVMWLSELQEMTNDAIDLGNKHHAAYKHLFNDFLVVQQGVFQWNENSNSYRKVADNYIGISKPVKHN